MFNFNFYFIGLCISLALFAANMICLVAVTNQRPTAKSIPIFYALGVIFAIAVIVFTAGGFATI